jgi:transcriptional regulator with XRE-family HTH domain
VKYAKNSTLRVILDVSRSAFGASLPYALAPMARRDESKSWDVRLFRQQVSALGERVRAARRSREWLQRELASRARIGRPSLSSIEGGKQNITLEVLWRLAAALEIHWADLLDDRTDAVPNPGADPTPFEEQLAAFGIRLYEARVLQRLSQQALMARTGIDQRAISLVETGTQNVTLETLSRLATGLGVHWAELLDDRQPHPPRPPRSR